MRVKDVSVTKTNGATERIVSSVNISTTVESSVPLRGAVKTESADGFIDTSLLLVYSL